MAEVIRIIRPTSVSAGPVTYPPDAQTAYTAGAVSAPTVTDESAWGDDSDATYAELELVGVTGSGYSRMDAVEFTLPPQPDLGALHYANIYYRHDTAEFSAVSDDWFIWVRFDGVTVPGTGTYGDTGSLVTGMAPAGTVTTWGGLSANYQTHPARTAEFEGLFREGATGTVFVWRPWNNWPSTVQRSRILEMGVELIFEPALTDPILRVHPRRDGRGTSSARALWPPPKAAQEGRWLPYGGGYR